MECCNQGNGVEEAKQGTTARGVRVVSGAKGSKRGVEGGGGERAGGRGGGWAVGLLRSVVLWQLLVFLWNRALGLSYSYSWLVVIRYN